MEAMGVICGPSNRPPTTEEIKQGANRIRAATAECESEMEREGVPSIIHAVGRRQKVAAEARTRIMQKGEVMHYRNGREAKNGDKIVSLAGYGSGPVNINAIGILFDATPGNDHCNGSIASTLGGAVVGACLCDCLHYDDVAALFVEKGLDKRPAGK